MSILPIDVLRIVAKHVQEADDVIFKLEIDLDIDEQAHKILFSSWKPSSANRSLELSILSHIADSITEMPGFVNTVDKSDDNIRFEFYFEPAEPYIAIVIRQIQNAIKSYSPKLENSLYIQPHFTTGYAKNTRKLYVTVKPNAMYAALMLIKSVPRTITEKVLFDTMQGARNRRLPMGDAGEEDL